MSFSQSASPPLRQFPRRFSRLVAAAVFCLSAVACGDDGLSPEADLERARALQLWNAQGLTRYTVEARISCFCDPVLNLWHELTVINDTVTAARLVDNVNDEIPPPSEVQPSFYSSVDALFDRIEEAARASDGSRVEASFDATTGLPVEVNFIAPPGVSDGGAVYYLRALKPIVSN